MQKENANSSPLGELTTDAFFDNRLKIMQYRSGYRFSLDAVLLSYYAGLIARDVILDLGTGCGVIPLIMSYRNPKIRIYGIEVQEELAEIAVQNVRNNHMEERITILCQDMVTLAKHTIPVPVDLVVCNPPYRKQSTGRINPNFQRAIARHEIRIDLNGILKTAYRMLDISGRFITIYPANRAAEILSQMHSNGLEPKFLRMIHSFHYSDASFMLVEARKGGHTGIAIAPPLIVYENDGAYTQEIEKIFLPALADPDIN